MSTLKLNDPEYLRTLLKAALEQLSEYSDNDLVLSTHTSTFSISEVLEKL